MRPRIVQIIFTALACALTIAGQQSGSKQERSSQLPVIAFVSVNVISMTSERVLLDQTVIVRDGMIVKLGPTSKTKPPKGALQIDGSGKFLMPGLVDMHTHLLSDDEFPDELGADELRIMLANGVTTVRLMNGTPEQLLLRERIAQREIVGPTVFVASPQLTGRKQGRVFNGHVVTTPEEARAAVRASQAAGYDFIKVTNFITRPVYDAIIETAKEIGMRVIGHVDTQVTVWRALEAKQQIEHLDAYLEAVLKDSSPIKVSVSDIGLFRKANWESLDYIDDNKVKEIAIATARAGIFSTPTLTFFKITFGTGVSEVEIRARPDFRFVPPSLREAWFAAGRRIWAAPPSEARRREYVRVRNLLVKEIYDAGGKIMAGSDTPEWFLLYGWSLHREIKNLVEAGLKPYAALEAATRNPAEFLKIPAGTIAVGKRADLILLEANPLEDVANTERRAGVMVHGRWFTELELRRMLDEIAPRFQNALD